jgi:hypothetical protein
MSAASSPPSIPELLERLHREGWLGWSHLRIWKQMRDYLRAHHDIAESAPAFFSLTAVAHFNAAILHMVRLLDKHKKAAGIEYLLNLAESQAKGFAHATTKQVLEQVKSDREILNDLRNRAAPLKARRDKLLAHLDRKNITDPKKLELLFRFEIDDLHGLYQSLSELVNRYEGLWSDAEELWELIGWEDFQNLVTLAERGQAAKRSR